ncbi:Mu transposase C-terminal domain-containing protein [Planctobacterium marinum]|uniref:Mu transposase C-terminal domain-containing protein n=1 Tax=Planctobacterium marinum TaxID=1631968 RepID=UPI001E60DE18|nr:Mu transposase C-terminal domain-containing protein [Planctobacterium marinum]MCC2606570.1 Mu transposase C-terminal domain-containing protein [Planctobacterium marinum]
MSKSQKVFSLQPGKVVTFEREEYVIKQILDLKYVLAEHLSTHEVSRIPIGKIAVVAQQNPASIGIEALTDEDWNVAQQRLEIIQPVLHKPGRTKTDMERVADEHGLHINTLYKWLRLYEQNCLLTSLAPKKRSDKGDSRLSQRVDEIIKESIETEYLNKLKKSVSSVHETIKMLCREEGIPAPHVNTVRNRIKQLSDYVKVSKRYGAKKAQEMYEPSPDQFPGADYPLAVVQIDHTPTDVILVDEEYRLPIGRAWITMAIDVFSRMVTGFYISLDPPSAISVGVAVSHAILPKDKWLIDHDIDGEWPCWGLPKTLHADNAGEFRGNMLKKACDQYQITLEWRPVARPKYGAHIERLLGSFSSEIHQIPGTTFSNIEQRGDYDSDKESVMTMAEFEQWLATLIAEKYHYKKHSGIGMPPIRKYEQGILGTKRTKGVGLPRKIEDEETLKIDFLPFEERTVQDYGIRINDIFYYHDVLRVWINSTVDSRSKLKRKFICRYDPRDVSVIWFFDPQINSYFPIPYRNLSHPAITKWEVQAARDLLKKEGEVDIDEDKIFGAVKKMREIVEQSSEKTKKSRRSLARKKAAEKKSGGYIEKPSEDYLANSSSHKEDVLEDEDILPFDEMEEVQSHG